MSDMFPLNSRKQELFAQAVVRGISHKQAAIEAGYSERSASAIGAQLMKRPKVSERIRELREHPPTKRSPGQQAVTITDAKGTTLGVFIPAALFAESLGTRA